MTYQSPSDRATGVKTGGEGKRTTAHLNLTHAMGKPPTAPIQNEAIGRAPREVLADYKIPYAGKEPR